MREPIADAYKRDSGGDNKLSGLRNSGTFRVGVTTRGDALAKGKVFIGGAMTGPAKWLNDGTNARRQGSGFHPGTRAKRTFDRAVDANIQAAAREMERLFDNAFRG